MKINHVVISGERSLVVVKTDTGTDVKSADPKEVQRLQATGELVDHLPPGTALPLNNRPTRL